LHFRGAFTTGKICGYHQFYLSVSIEKTRDKVTLKNQGDNAENTSKMAKRADAE